MRGTIGAAGAIALAVWTGCAGAAGPVAPGSGGPIGQCTAALIAGSLLAPAPGATGVPTSQGAISFSVGNAAMLAGTFLLTPAGGGAPIPGGTITGTASNAFVIIPVLQPHTTYAASLSANLPGDACNPRSAFLGSFTTA